MTWQDEFDEEIAPLITDYGGVAEDLQLQVDIKTFIQKTIDKAVSKREAEIVEEKDRKLKEIIERHRIKGFLNSSREPVSHLDILPDRKYKASQSPVLLGYGDCELATGEIENYTIAQDTIESGDSHFLLLTLNGEREIPVISTEDRLLPEVANDIAKDLFPLASIQKEQ